MQYLPVCLDLQQRRCLVVGGGTVAARKIALLRAAGASIHIVAPELCEALAAERDAGLLTHAPRPFTASDLDGMTLAIAATNCRAVNAEVSQLAQARGLPVNVVDCPELCSFIMPAIIDRSPVLVAVSTGGAAPVLARLLRARLEQWIPPAFGRLATWAARWRSAVQDAVAADQRRRLWEDVLEGPIGARVLQGDETQADAELQALLAAPMAASGGEVYLVGGGPGDPDLLTLRAHRLMQQADVVVYDRLISPAVLDRVRRDADRIYVGKRRDQHALSQDGINRLLIDLAGRGLRVLRLKGGDPFIFGRGGEEVEALIDAGIAFQVVPGITAASGCATYAGIPLTHRDHAQSCVFLTGHSHDGRLDLPWAHLVQPRQTLVFYMGLQALDSLCQQLIGHGLDPATPAAMIEKGTWSDQRVVTGTLTDLPGRVRQASLTAPTLLIVGSVVLLHHRFCRSATPTT